MIGKLLGYLAIGIMMFIAFVCPILITLINVFFLIKLDPKSKKLQWLRNYNEVITWILGPFLSAGYLMFSDIIYVGYEEQLTNTQSHFPIRPEHMLTIVVICVISCICYFFLRVQPGKYRAPLVTVICIGGMYMGALVSILWVIQILYTPKLPYIDPSVMLLTLFPINCIILMATRIRVVATEWKEIQDEDRTTFNIPILNKLNDMVMDSTKWPLAGLIAMLPFLAIVVCVLVLFGQKPDAVIRAFTETSDWNLSAKVSPVNLAHDEHYLCTVAAGGHRKVVKPIRKGYRHGHEVVVNRQLCIANAFEQILEERTPKFHKAVRGFYDKYGFPVAKLIKSRYIADAVYYIMKPLEWFFLIIIYLCDAKPENRIAMQYTGR